LRSALPDAGLSFLASVLLATAPAVDAATFCYASSGDVLTLDPHSGNESLTHAMKDSIYEGLVHRKWDLSIEPALAVSWTQTDARTWRFHLRHGVTFHDGTPFTADDVVFSRDGVEVKLNPGDAILLRYATVKETGRTAVRAGTRSDAQ
jgi:peptide/nickel transport system substrate-binding protein